jgi:hypothetical protein
VIHIIGTCHKTQIWTDLVKNRALGAAPRSKVEAFQKYLTQTAIDLHAVAIGEEMNEERILVHGCNAISVAQMVARRLQIPHVFCEPDKTERQKLGLRVGQEMLEHASAIATKTGRALIDVREEEVRKQFPLRERFWATRLASLSRNSDSVIFICGADHCETLPKTLRQKSLENRVHCADWTLLSEISCPCCM